MAPSGKPGPGIEALISDRSDVSGSPSGRWTHDGRHVVDDCGDLVAVARDPLDARRMAAAVNAVRGIPTEALEAWHVEIVEPEGSASPASASLTDESVAALESYVNDRRIGERRRRDRRHSHAGAPPAQS